MLERISPQLLCKFLAGSTGIDDETRRKIVEQKRIVGSPVWNWFQEMDAKLSDPFNVDWGALACEEPILNEGSIADASEKNAAHGHAEPVRQSQFIRKWNRVLALRDWLRSQFYRMIMNLKIGLLLSDLGRCTTIEGGIKANAELTRLIEWATRVRLEAVLARRLFRLGRGLLLRQAFEATAIVQKATIQLCKSLQVVDDSFGDTYYDALFLLGQAEHQLGQLDAARIHLTEALELAKTRFGVDSRLTSGITYDLGFLEEDSYHWDDTERRYQDAHLHYEKHRMESPYDAKCLAGIARCEMARGNFESSEQLLSTALELAKPFTGSTASAEVLSTLGNLHFAQQKYDLALTEYKEASGRYEKLRGLNSHTCANAYMNMGLSQVSLKDYVAAEGSIRKGTQILRSIFGDHHLRVANGLNNLGLLEEAKGNINVALELHRSAIDIRTNQLGKTNALTAISLHNLGALLMRVGDTAQALKHFEEALPVLKTLGELHPAFIIASNNICVARGIRGEVSNDEVAATRAQTFARLSYLMTPVDDASGKVLIPVRIGQSHHLMSLAT